MAIVHELNAKVLLGILLGCIAMLWLPNMALSAQESSGATESWWKQEKIRFFWGTTGASFAAGIPVEEVMRNLSLVGGTVYVSNQQRTGYNVGYARLAHEFGMKYFGIIYGRDVHALGEKMKCPNAINKDGGYYFENPGQYAPCPLYKPLYEEGFLKPLIEAAKTGVIDGMHIDWEPYGRPEAGVCYCDNCFERFLETKGLHADVGEAQRYEWLKSHNLTADYVENFGERRIEMFREFERRVHQIKPDFVFSGYHVKIHPISCGMNTPEVPFIVVDQRHYREDHTRPWWESWHARYHGLGFLHVAGSFDYSFFGRQPESDVSATQWMYDAAMHADGYWMWFEGEINPDLWRAFEIANRRIRATEEKVGEFLLHGEQDIHFATPVEWSGSPRLAQKIVQRTYHLGDEHLVHINNVDTDRPVKIRLRLPQLPENIRWTVRDPISDLRYVHNGDGLMWSSRQLKRGIVVSLEKRSELFLQVSPAREGVQAAAVGVIPSQEIQCMPPHPSSEGICKPRY